MRKLLISAALLSLCGVFLIGCSGSSANEDTPKLEGKPEIKNMDPSQMEGRESRDGAAGTENQRDGG